MGKFIDLTGRKFGRLTVLYRQGKNKFNQITWHCSCVCGGYLDVTGNPLQTGNTKSCGCLRIDFPNCKKTHGLSRTRLYKVWMSMKQRCQNSRNSDYRRYGGRGINVCEEWKDYQTFYDWSLANGYLEGLTLDRISNDLGYSPDNCRWTTQKVQLNNHRRNNLLTYNGKTQSISLWAEELGISMFAILSRIQRGLLADKVFFPGSLQKHTGNAQGSRGDKLDNVWWSMRKRCLFPKCAFYKDYGGRGIGICDEWSDKANFKEWAIKHGYQEHLSLERIDVNGNCPTSITFVHWRQLHLCMLIINSLFLMLGQGRLNHHL